MEDEEPERRSVFEQLADCGKGGLFPSFATQDSILGQRVYASSHGSMNCELFKMDKAGEDGRDIQYGRGIPAIVIFCPDWYKYQRLRENVKIKRMVRTYT